MHPFPQKFTYFALMEKKEWFASWFDTAYYHILYRSRDEHEAERFIKKLVDFLGIKSGAKVLDLACGKGRHAKTLSELNLKVTGLDLSENSIQKAKLLECSNLNFDVHDMRTAYPGKFEVIFNLFTSFGYFDDQKDNERVIQAVHSMLSPNGLFVIDFMNAHKVIRNLVPSELKTIDGIKFQIERTVQNGHIIKNIDFTDQGSSFHFQEKVQTLTVSDFRRLLQTNGFEITNLFGNYDLGTYDEYDSDRLIIIAKRSQ
jgi:2-polyprenyl-3-methyl-5-hydroxy-6-metoxy-1,4-benzoquinol methylase